MSNRRNIGLLAEMKQLGWVQLSELKDEVREWAAYCRAVQPGPNLADKMLAYIGDPPHDYTSDTEVKHGT
jgi:hypothetical protein